MNTKQLEQVIRSISQGNLGQPAIAGVVDNGDAQLPEEFRIAAKTLFSRTRQDSGGKSILQIMTQGWT